MRKNLRTMLLAAALVGGQHVLSSANFLTPTFAGHPYSVSIAIPNPSMDFSDLDARDENNKPLRATAAQRHLENLFVSSLNEMLLNNLTPLRRQFFALMSGTWDMLSGWLRKAISIAIEKIQAWLKDTKLKIQHSGRFWWHNIRLLALAAGFQPATSVFHFHIDFLISTTCLLR